MLKVVTITTESSDFDYDQFDEAFEAISVLRQHSATQP